MRDESGKKTLSFKQFKETKEKQRATFFRKKPGRGKGNGKQQEDLSDIVKINSGIMVPDSGSNVSNVTSNQLGFDSSISLEGLAVFEHLSPRQQSLFNEAKTFKVAHKFKFCWAKGGAVFLRKGDESHVIKIKKEEDLLSLIRMEHSPE